MKNEKPDAPDIYKRLAQTLDALPNGFPSTDDGSEIRLLKKLFTPEDAAVAVLLTPTMETADSIASRTGREKKELREILKSMARRGLITSGRVEDGLGFGLMPFIVGIYEEQVGSMDKELAQLAEAYFKKSFWKALMVQPQFHRVVPVGEDIRSTMEVHPYESATELVNAAQAWGVLDCICRKQKDLIGEACGKPIDVCMALYEIPGAFNDNPTIHPITREEALATLKRASDAGLVHSVSNNRQGLHYICNCCSCCCGILRGMKELGLANVIARSAFVNTVDETLCNACEACIERCQFGALTMEAIVQVESNRCVGCGICIQACPSEALSLVRRPEEEILPIPETLSDWKSERLSSRGLTT